MKAAVITRYGPPEVIELRDVPAPVPKDDEVRVRVHASTVCYGDRLIRQGPLLVRLLGGWRRPKASILGVDLAGTVESVGRRVTRFVAGDQVFGSRGDKFGAHAEFACVAEHGFLATSPRNMTPEEAATISGVCGPANVELVRSLGADAVIDYTTHDFAGDGQAYDVICDVLGKAGSPRSLRALEPRGAWTHLRGRAVFMAGPARPVQGDLEFLKTLIEDGRLRAVIGRTYPLKDIVEAHRYADSGHKVGNVVVVIP